MSDTRPLLDLTLTGDDAPINAAGSAVYELALGVGIEPKRAARIRVMVEELVSEAQAREHGEHAARVGVTARVEAGRLKVSVTDTGLPVDQTDIAAARLPHELVRLGFTEQFTLQAHGTAGNLAECTIVISMRDARDKLRVTERVLPKDAPEAADVDSLEIRPMGADECSGLARLVYRCYEYSYPSADIYYPDRMAALIEGELMHSVVTVNSEGEIVGHAAGTKSSKESRVAEAGKLVVDPRYRSQGLAKRMADLRLATARENGLSGMWTECVTNHPYSQRNQVKLGATETGLLLGILPPGVHMAKIDAEDSEARPTRGSLITMYLPVTDHPLIQHVPERYRALVQDVVDRVGLQREFAHPCEAPAGDSRISVAVRPELGIAIVTVQRVGGDLLPRLEERLQELLRMRTAAIYLDLPLSDPGTGSMGDRISGFGFFFSALLPEAGEQGDVLRMQLLNQATVDPAQIHLATDWGEALMGEVMRDKERVEERARSLRLSG